MNMKRKHRGLHYLMVRLDDELTFVVGAQAHKLRRTPGMMVKPKGCQEFRFFIGQRERDSGAVAGQRGACYDVKGVGAQRASFFQSRFED